MRVTLNLSMFFHDHRSLAKIFINKNMKFIKDVENHITNIFGIRNFFLKCENQYLPPVEDIQILNNDEVIWALPCDKTTIVPCANSTLNVTREEERPKVKNKNYQGDETMEVEDIPVIHKKKKTKKKHREIEEELAEPETKKKKIRDSEKNCHEIETESENKKKKGNEKQRKKRKENIVSESTGELNQEENDNSFTKNEEKCSSVKSLVDSFEKKSVNSCTKKNHLIIDNSTEKRVNIVKTIIVSNGNIDVFKDEHLHDTKVHSNNLNTENNTSVDDNTSVTSNVDTSSLDMCQPRKRKRIRRHKNKKNFDLLKKLDLTPFVKIPEPTSIVNFRPLEVAPVHLRFDEEVSNKNEIEMSTEKEEKCDVITKAGPEKNEIEVNEDFISSHIINLDEPFDEEKIVKSILQFPIFSGEEPRIGDVVAFKILRISENYTPEVSSWIVGKVLSYKNKEVIFDILYGQNQCLNPKGKFCLEPEEPQEQNNEFNYFWQNLFEPRIIFP
ncbi:coilin-like [Tribolium madens]|uniref:coilin-like n=1 Tax=Tribolium madens TaxID=41895 RepID=UPI001CF75854|nr:coilin-like [Tribolium madens]